MNTQITRSSPPALSFRMSVVDREAREEMRRFAAYSWRMKLPTPLRPHDYCEALEAWRAAGSPA